MKEVWLWAPMAARSRSGAVSTQPLAMPAARPTPVSAISSTTKNSIFTVVMITANRKFLSVSLGLNIAYFNDISSRQVCRACALPVYWTYRSRKLLQIQLIL